MTGLSVSNNVFLYGVRYGIRTRILRLLAPCHGALTFRPNAHIGMKPMHMLADLYFRCAQAPGGRNPSLLSVSKLGGNGEIRTHGPLSESTVFKTVAINRTLPRFQLTI